MTTAQVEVDNEALKKATRKGVVAAVLLAVLTIIEFFIATGLENPLIPLLPFVVIKGWIILDYFMHVRALWSEDH
ncbi:MAG: cytochrome C oxidase subunit IV family protein [Actinomycetia bacterium]|nr:cytochrome C oxidase subunit IV family protein [Actinomycetes bacterium]